MRQIVRAILIAALFCAKAAAETHIGFESELDRERNVVRVKRFYAAANARNSGLYPGDFVLAIDNLKVKSPKTPETYAKWRKPGDEVIVTVERNNRPFPIRVILVEGDEMRKGGFLEW